MRPEIKYHFLRWLMGLSNIIDGLCLIISIGFWTPALGL
jgi:hypothetical protein